MPRSPIQTRTPLKIQVRQLEDDLYLTRVAIVELMQEELRELLHKGVLCKTFDDLSHWEQDTAAEIINFALRAQQPTEINLDGRARVLCPLCNEGPLSPYDKGFLPEGLRRHLTGTYNAHQCSVFKAANALASDHVRRTLTSQV